MHKCLDMPREHGKEHGQPMWKPSYHRPALHDLADDLHCWTRDPSPTDPTANGRMTCWRILWDCRICPRHFHPHSQESQESHKSQESLLTVWHGRLQLRFNPTQGRQNTTRSLPLSPSTSPGGHMQVQSTDNHPSSSIVKHHHQSSLRTVLEHP